MWEILQDQSITISKCQIGNNYIHCSWGHWQIGGNIIFFLQNRLQLFYRWISATQICQIGIEEVDGIAYVNYQFWYSYNLRCWQQSFDCQNRTNQKNTQMCNSWKRKRNMVLDLIKVSGMHIWRDSMMLFPDLNLLSSIKAQLIKSWAFSEFSRDSILWSDLFQP